MSTVIQVKVLDPKGREAPFEHLLVETPSGPIAKVTYDPNKRGAYTIPSLELKKPIRNVTIVLKDARGIEKKTVSATRDSTVTFHSTLEKPLPDENPSEQPRRHWSIFAGAGLVSLLVALLVGYYALQHADQVLALGWGRQIYFVVVAILGVAVAFALFGLLKSYAEWKGAPMGFVARATGPFAGLIVFLIFAFYLPTLKSGEPQLITLEFHLRGPDPVKDMLASTKIQVLAGLINQQLNFNDLGTAVLTQIPTEVIAKDGVDVQIESSVYEDASGSENHKVELQRPIVTIQLKRK